MTTRKFYEYDGLGGGIDPKSSVKSEMTQTMTKEQILEKRISCTCNEAYKTRQMADPDCGRCNWYEEIISCMDFFAQQQLSAERERAGKLVEALEECSTALLTETNMLTAYSNAIKTIIEYEKES